jgi:uroporphyrinogen-III synthase
MRRSLVWRRSGYPACRHQVFAVGPGTARALQAHGLDSIITPDGQDSEALLALPQLADVAGKRVVIVRGVGGRALLADTLRARGAQVDFMECYRRMRPRADAGAAAGALARRRDRCGDGHQCRNLA